MNENSNHSLIIQPKRCLIFAMILCFFGVSVMAQTAIDNTTPKAHNNELGIDISSFFKQFFSIGNNLDAYTPNYYLTYRHHFKKSNLRMAIGGFGTYNDQTSQSTGGGSTYKIHNDGFSIDFRIGYEWARPVGAKWKVFYGFDVRPTMYYSNSTNHTVGSSITVVSERFAQIYGVAPILGFRFMATERLCLIMESSIAFNIQFLTGKEYYSYTGLPAPKDNLHATKFFTSYYQPVSITLTYDL